MSTPLEDYKEMLLKHGETRKEALLRREKRYIADKIRHNQSYHKVLVDGVEQIVSIANSDNLNEKMIFSMPDEDLRHGAYVYWMDNWWLITERDANTTVYTRCRMLQCNHLLRWVNDEDKICEIWAVVEDGTKLRHLVSAQSNLRVKISIELLGSPKSLRRYSISMKQS